MPAAPRRIDRSITPDGCGKPRRKKGTPRRTKSHKFRAQDFVRKRKNESLTDNYTLGKLLGEGQFGEVFIGTVITAATSKGDNNTCKGDQRAIKRIQKELLTVEDHDEVFNEFTILRQMDHPNICKMYEFFEDKDSFWFVQELCSGGELLDELERVESFPEAGVALIVKQVLSCVHYCHSQKSIVHRDLKLENILLEEGNQQQRDTHTSYNPMIVKVIDFGLACTYKEGEPMSAPVGSMHYIAPEVLECEYDYKCDIWSCGVIAYILLCGYAPFDAPSDRDMRELIMMGHVSFNDPAWDKVSEEAKEFVSYLMTYEPEKRPDAGQALKHPWIQNAHKAHAEQLKANKEGTDIILKALKNCQSFEAESKLKQATCAFMTSQLVLSNSNDGEDEQVKSAVGVRSGEPSAMMIGEVFRAMDFDSNGSIELEEWRLGCLDFLVGISSLDMTVEEVDDIFRRMDLSCNGLVDYSEFVVAAMGLHNQECPQHQELLKQAFERLVDKDGSGFISKRKLKEEMEPFYGEDMEEEILQKIIDQADSDQDGKISWSDFQAMMSRKADFVPPANATPLTLETARVQEAAEATKEEAIEPVQAEAAETALPVSSSAPIETISKLSADQPEETNEQNNEKKSNLGPRARLISAVFEKNLEKNKEHGIEAFRYTNTSHFIRPKPTPFAKPTPNVGTDPSAESVTTQKRKLPRTRRMNFEELMKRASVQVDFDPTAIRAGRNKEIEELKATPGRARERRQSVMTMFQQEKEESKSRKESRLREIERLNKERNADGSKKGGEELVERIFNDASSRKLEQEKREQRRRELQNLRSSVADDSGAKKRLFELWNDSTSRTSMTSEDVAGPVLGSGMKELDHSLKSVERPGSMKKNFVKSRGSLPPSYFAGLTGRKSDLENLEKVTSKEKTANSLTREDAAQQLGQDEVLVDKEQPQLSSVAKRKDKNTVGHHKLAMNQPVRGRLPSHEFPKQQNDERLNDTINGGDSEEALSKKKDNMRKSVSMPEKPVCKSLGLRATSKPDENMAKVEEQDETEDPAMSMSMSETYRSERRSNPSRLSSSMHHYGGRERDRQARMEELKQITEHKARSTKSARAQFEEQIQANKSRSQSLFIAGGTQSTGARSYSRSSLPWQQRKSAHARESQRAIPSVKEGEELDDSLGDLMADQSMNDFSSGGDLSSTGENSLKNYDSFNSLSYRGNESNPYFGMGSINELSFSQIPEEDEGIRSQGQIEKVAQTDSRRIRTPKNVPRLGSPNISGKAIKKISCHDKHFAPGKTTRRMSAPVASVAASSGMTEAQLKFQEMARQRQLKAKIALGEGAETAVPNQ